jgi:Flp pilus assembly protein TadG
MRLSRSSLRLRSSLGRRAMKVCNFACEKKSGSGVGKLLNDTGSSLVEFSLAASVLFLALFGIIEMCFALYIYNYVSDAARVGTRYAMVRGTGCSASLTGCGADQAAIVSYLRSLPYPGMDAAKLNATVQWYQLNASGPTGWSTACTCPNPKNEVQVTVIYQFPLQIPYFPSGTINIQSTSQMVISN